MLFGSLINPTSSSYSRLNCVGCGTPPPPGWSIILLPCPVTTSLFHVWLCIQEVEIMSLTPPLPFLANLCPVSESNYFHPPSSFNQMLGLHCPGWNLEILGNGPQELPGRTSLKNYCSFWLNWAFLFCLPFLPSVDSFGLSLSTPTPVALNSPLRII